MKQTQKVMESYYRAFEQLFEKWAKDPNAVDPQQLDYAAKKSRFTTDVYRSTAAQARQYFVDERLLWEFITPFKEFQDLKYVEYNQMREILNLVAHQSLGDEDDTTRSKVFFWPPNFETYNHYFAWETNRLKEDGLITLDQETENEVNIYLKDSKVA
jgi:hypothetical protein